MTFSLPTVSAGLPAMRANPQDVAAQIDALARRYRAADRGVVRVLSRAGGMVEHQIDRLPAETREALHRATRTALLQAHHAVGLTEGRRSGTTVGAHSLKHKLTVTASGAVAGFFGPAGLAEIPVGVCLFLREIRAVARDHGFDPDDPSVAAECLSVFASGGPLVDDDGVDSAFLSARIAMNGATLNALLRRVSARLAQVFAQKLGAQAVPVLGALGGGAVNYAFAGYYTEMAQVKFGLKTLSQSHDPAMISLAFRSAVESKSTAERRG